MNKINFRILLMLFFGLSLAVIVNAVVSADDHGGADLQTETLSLNAVVFAVLGIFMVVCLVVGWISIFLLKPWGRHLFASANVGGCFSLIFYEGGFKTGTSEVLGGLLYMLAGYIIAICYHRFPRLWGQ